MNESPASRSRPSAQLLAALREGKRQLHASRAGLPLREKVALVLELQRICLPLIMRRRALQPWERPWPTAP
jgi:hypothetical protein